MDKYASTALKLGLGYDAVQKFTPRGETGKFVSSSKYLISEDLLNAHTRKAKSMNLVFRHISFTKGGECSVGPDQNKNSAAFAIVSEPPSKAIHQAVFSVTLEMEENNLRKAGEGSNKVIALIQKFTVNLICDTKGVGLGQL